MSGAGVGTDTLLSIENIRGSDFADTYVATGFTGVSPDSAACTATFNEFEGMAGDDTITGNGSTQLSYLSATAGVTVDFTSGAGHGASGTAPAMPRLAPTPSPACKSSAARSSPTRCYGSNNLTGRGEFFRAAAATTSSMVAAASTVRLYWFRTDDNVTGGITVNMAAGTVVGDASVGTDTLRSIEAVRGTNFADSYDATGFTTTVNAPNAGSAGHRSVAATPSTNSRGWAATTPSPATATRGLPTSTRPPA